MLLRTLLAVALALYVAAAPAATRGLVILANFPDAVSRVEAGTYDRFFNDPTYAADNAARSVSSHLRTISGGRADFTFTVTDWLTLPHPVAYYVAMDPGGMPQQGPIAMLRDAVAILTARGFDFSPFDNDGDGKIDLLGMVHRGNDPAFGSGVAPTWSTVPNIEPPIRIGGLRVERAWMITESDPAFGTITTLGGVAHEMIGHALCGLPDLYGRMPAAWAPMWGGHPFRPTGFDAFSRHTCGWTRVEDVEAAGEIRLPPADAGGQAYRLWIDPWRENEYFLLEYRRQAGIDAGLPGSGLLVWHIDLAAGQNAFLDLKQADGRRDLDSTTGLGAADAGDPYPGSTGNTQMTPTTSPDTRSRRGEDTGIVIDGIRSDAGTLRARVTPRGGMQGITLAYDETYPGFAWNWTPDGGHAAGQSVAVRFTSPDAGQLTALRVKYWGPPLAASGLRYTLKIHGDFAAGNRLPAAPRFSITGRLDAAGDDNGWHLLPIDPPYPLAAGQHFVAELIWDEPMIVIDYPGKASGRSYYRRPGTDAFQPMAHDLRERARIATATHAPSPAAEFRAGILLVPRVDLPGALFQATAVQLQREPDGGWRLLSYVPDPSIVAAAPARFADDRLEIAEVVLPESGQAYRNVIFTVGSDGRLFLHSAQAK